MSDVGPLVREAREWLRERESWLHGHEIDSDEDYASHIVARLADALEASERDLKQALATEFSPTTDEPE